MIVAIPRIPFAIDMRGEIPSFLLNQDVKDRYDYQAEYWRLANVAMSKPVLQMLELLSYTLLIGLIFFCLFSS